MDQIKSLENESLRQEILRLRQQMTEMHRAWVSGLPPPLFPIVDPANTLSFLSQLQAPCPNVVDPPQHALKFIPSQKNLNTSASIPLAPQLKPTTFITPHVVGDFVAQSSAETSTLACRPIVGIPHATSGPMLNTLGDHCYTLETAFMLVRPPKFLDKKPSVLEESEKIVGKMKGTKNAMKSSLGLVSKEDVSYKNRGMSSSINPPPSLNISKFEEQDGQKEFVKHLGQYCNQLKKNRGEMNGKYTTIVIVGVQAHPRRRRRRCRQSQAQVNTQTLYNPSQNPLYSFSPPLYLVYCDNHMLKSLLTHNGAYQLLRVTFRLDKPTKAILGLILDSSQTMK